MSGNLPPGPGRKASSIYQQLVCRPLSSLKTRSHYTVFEMMSDIIAETLLTQQISNAFQGDSGGPLMCLDEGHWTAIGESHAHAPTSLCASQ